MNEHSILLDANPSVLKSLSLNSTDSIPKALRATNTGTALGILNQICFFFLLSMMSSGGEFAM